MVFYKQQRGSPWINNFAEAERWVNEQENNRLNLDNIEGTRRYTKVHEGREAGRQNAARISKT